MSPRRAISDFALIGDGNCAGLVDRDGTLAWLCWPRFDSEAPFASLLGGDDNGEWRIAPDGGFRARRRYRPETLILETQFEAESGAALLVDFMPYQDGRQALVRRLRGLRGVAPMTARFAPRLHCGRDRPAYRRIDGGVAVDGGVALNLRCTRPELAKGERAVGFELAEGETIDFVFSSADTPPSHPAAYVANAEAACESFWRRWSAQCRYQGPWSALVRRSLITLKALVYAPSGGIVAAPTTSLPEHMGGARNWDYRYCWLRDATFTVLALMHAGYVDEAGAWVNWLIRALASEGGRTRVFYGVVPGAEIEEREADWLSGFNGSRPVRLGNRAKHQLQLDIFGEVQDTLHQWRTAIDRPEPVGWDQQRAMLAELESAIDQPDAGIWEQRGHREYFTQSRVLAWVAFDRALRSAKRFGFASDAGWKDRLQSLRAEICQRGFDPRIGGFTRSYGSASVDASCLLIAMVGFLPADDPRILGTVEAIRNRLSDGPFVYRYAAERENDGVGGPEGAFLPCSFWLADNLILQGRDDDAAALFERLAAVANDVGLLSEEYDVAGRQMLGNFPQALTHLSLVHTALNLTGAGPAHRRSEAAY